MGDTFSPVNVLEEGAGEAKGEQARMASIMGALAVADLVKSSLGPKGMDKILQSTGRGGSVSVRTRLACGRARCARPISPARSEQEVGGSSEKAVGGE